MKSEFRKDNKNDCTLYSPQPNIFFAKVKDILKELEVYSQIIRFIKLGL